MLPVFGIYFSRSMARYIGGYSWQAKLAVVSYEGLFLVTPKIQARITTEVR